MPAIPHRRVDLWPPRGAQADFQERGYNEAEPDRRTPLRIIWRSCASRCGAATRRRRVYLALGDLKEALILLAFAAVSVVITVVQETRRSVLEALRDLPVRAHWSSRRRAQRIAGREVVRGDFVVLAEEIACR
jgi:Ca2+-transporting ATPase